MLKKLLIGLMAVVAIVLSIVVRQGATFTVERHIDIRVTPDKIFPLISDPQQWRQWPAGKSLATARVAITSATAPTSIALTMTFAKPIPPTSQAAFTLVRQGDTTRVTWRMHGPLSVRTRLITAFIGMDVLLGSELEKGLGSLKSLAEK
jgi:hypothetical protein